MLVNVIGTFYVWSFLQLRKVIGWFLTIRVWSWSPWSLWGHLLDIMILFKKICSSWILHNICMHGVLSLRSIGLLAKPILAFTCWWTSRHFPFVCKIFIPKVLPVNFFVPFTDLNNWAILSENLPNTGIDDWLGNQGGLMLHIHVQHN